jgi:carotenoid cleavage dioxygenase-like enzyme
VDVHFLERVKTSLKPTNHPYLTGPWTPSLTEATAIDLDVIEGRIPDDIDGIYVRNTENQVHQPLGNYHPFDGDGMLHVINFRNGKADYRNRFVRTRGFAAEQEAGQSLWGGLMDPPGTSLRPGFGAHGALKDSSSTDVVVHAGKIVSTFYQCGEAYLLDPETLEQEGIAGWGPIDGVSAHPKVDEATGEMLFFNYGVHAPYMHYGVVDRTGKCVHYVQVPLPGPRLPHDMAFTKNFSILNDFPLFWDLDLLKRDVHVSRFHPEMKSRFAVIPRYGRTEDIRWFEADPTYVLHWQNAYEEGDEIVLDGYFQEDPMPRRLEDAPEGMGQMMAFLDEHSFRPKLHRWRFNLRTGETTEHHLDDRILEFGMFNQRYAGIPYRYAYSTTTKPGWFLFNGFVKHDLKTGESWDVKLPDGVYASEAPFVPRIDAIDEDDGYLVSFLIDENNLKSECILIDCKDFAAGPVVRIALPHKISSGTHSTWADRRFIEEGHLAGRRG